MSSKIFMYKDLHNDTHSCIMYLKLSWGKKMAYGQNTYWEEKGLHQEMANELNLLIPFMGSVENKRYRKKLERYRKAANAYYDIFNNGGYNMGREIGATFGALSDLIKLEDWEAVYEIVEPIMHKIIVEAYLAERHHIDLVKQLKANEQKEAA